MKAEKTEWWLDESGLPTKIWARLTVDAAGVRVLDCDGVTRQFESEESARLSLLEDEYLTLAYLIEDGLLPPDTMPPSAQDERTLVDRMLDPR